MGIESRCPNKPKAILESFYGKNLSPNTVCKNGKWKDWDFLICLFASRCSKSGTRITQYGLRGCFCYSWVASRQGFYINKGSYVSWKFNIERRVLINGGQNKWVGQKSTIKIERFTMIYTCFFYKHSIFQSEARICLSFSQIEPQNMLKICLSYNIQKSKFHDLTYVWAKWVGKG